jgi:ribosomal protein S18 acetylase RimI-like enzyme
MIIRNADPADAREVARVHVRSWQAAYRGLFPDDFLDALRPEDRESRYTFGSTDPAAPRTILAVIDPAVVGFATTSPSSDEDLPGVGEVAALYIDPSHWRSGIGGALLDEALARLRAAGYVEALLWVLVGNQAAQRFYRTQGWQADGARRDEAPWGIKAEVVRYRRSL